MQIAYSKPRDKGVTQLMYVSDVPTTLPPVLLLALVLGGIWLLRRR